MLPVADGRALRHHCRMVTVDWSVRQPVVAGQTGLLVSDCAGSIELVNRMAALDVAGLDAIVRLPLAATRQEHGPTSH